MTARLRSRPGRFAPAHDVGPTAEVIARWERAVRILEASRLSRRQDETLTEHAARAAGLESVFIEGGYGAAGNEVKRAGRHDNPAAGWGVRSP